MVSDERHCLDVLQQLNAVASAVRETAMVALELQVTGCVADAVRTGDVEGAVADVMAVARRASRSR
jgi:DNA-binding FrmR family transcriptional regulator